MHPLLLPWSLSADVLAVLAYVLAVVAAGVAAWMIYQRGDESPMGRFGWPAITFAGAAALGAWIVHNKVLPLEAQPLPLHTYGLMIALGFIAAIHLSGREAERTGFAKKEQIFDLAFNILIWSMVGSRVLFIIVNWDGPTGYRAHPENILKIWTGGLVFFGGFIGATIASFVWARRHKVAFPELADIVIPTLALGHFFGRMGCIAAGCCWGKVCHDPGFLLGIQYPPGALAHSDMARRGGEASAYIAEHGVTQALHPTQVYEGGGELILFLLLTWYRPRKKFHGQILAMWLMAYSVLRLSIETFRGDWGRGMLLRIPEADPVLLSTSQTIASGLFLLGLTLFFVWRNKARAPDAVAAA